MDVKKKKIIFNNRYIFVNSKPIVIVGICPGNQRKHERTFAAWEGNRSADLLNQAIKNNKNIILTNIANVNIENPTKSKLKKYIKHIESFLIKVNPSKIICLGNLPYEILSESNKNYKIYKLNHPSFIIRFKKNKNAWKKKLKKLL